MKKTLLVGLFLCAQFGFAQNTKSLKSILFQNETVRFNAEDNGEEIIHGNYQYILVQHPELTITGNFYGFETMNYVPHNAAYARVEKSQLSAATEALEAAGGRVLKIKDAWRLSKSLFNQDFSEWARAEDGQSLVLWVQYWKGLSHFEVLQSLMAKGVLINQERSNDRQIQITWDPERINELLDFTWLQYVEEKSPDGEPENYTASTNHRVNFLQQGQFNGNSGLNYDGTGIMVAHNDAGEINDHVDFRGRITQSGPFISIGQTDHGFHTAGTIFGAGNRDPRGKGMAPGADLFYSGYPSTLYGADALYSSINARLTSSSFSNGCNNGYTNDCQTLDKDARDIPNLLHVFSAGNAGTSDCGYGAGSGWGNITGGHKVAKNVITVGNLTLIDNLAGSSSRGPAEDGRIKPDVCAVGTNVFSTTDFNGTDPHSYDSKTGTSMSCPGVTGTLAVLMQAYKDLHLGVEPHGSLLKGILMNTTEDLGNAGPDFRFGYGRVNARRAYQVIEGGTFDVDSVSTGDSATFTFNIPSNIGQARFLVIWPDREATGGASRALVNDLDMTVDFGGTNYQPWVLNPNATVAQLNSPATRQRDSLNNMEQVTINNPASGLATLKVKGYDVPQGPQTFFVIAYYESNDIQITYPVAGMGLGSGETELVRFDAPQNVTYTTEYSLNGGTTWLNLNAGTSNRVVSWFVPNTASDNVYIRVYSANDTDIVGPFTVVPIPFNLDVVGACPDSVHLAWDSVPNVSGYVIYQLGPKYMDSVAYISGNTEVWLSHNPQKSDWYAIASVVNGTSKGFRSVAIEKIPGIFNCSLPNDLDLVAVLTGGDLPDCVVSSNSSKPAILVRNTGNTPYTSFDVGFKSRTSANANIETVNRTLNPGDTLIYFFQNSSITLLNSVNQFFDFWISASPDANPFNDSLELAGRVISNGTATVTAPYSEDFDSFNSCANTTNCGGTNCTLNGGWSNYQNNISDDIDFRTWSGSTASAGTGPSVDFSLGTSQGKYLYTEASGDCDSAEAFLLTPCLDLSETWRPHATIYYHMLGGNEIGRLGADVFDGSRWYYNIVPEIVGNQGATWQPMTIDLSQFAGQTVVIRYRGKTGNGFRSDIAIDAFSLLDSSSIGISENAWSQGLRLFPNPSNGQFTLSSEFALDSETEVKITDVSGAIIWEGPFEANAGAQSMDFNLVNHAKGVYLLEIQNEEYRKTLRLIKE
jgi:hypothetical protein